MKKYDSFRKSGTFTLANGSKVHGELSLNGARTSLDLYSDSFFNTLSSRDLHGTFYDLTKVSLIDCITLSGPGRGYRGNESYHYSGVFPHYVLFGDEHIGSEDRKIREMSFAFDDSGTVFHDFDAFGWATDSAQIMEHIASANTESRKIEVGEHPEVFYFTGKHEIFSIDTVFGKISAAHFPSITFPGPHGIRVDNSIKINLAFDHDRTVKEAADQLIDVLRFLEMIAGRPQNITDIVFRLRDTEEHPLFLDAYWCMPPRRSSDDEARKPHPADLPLQAAKNPATFATVLASWLERNDAWKNARARFASVFSHQNRYGIDRLVGAANMFDIMPSSAVPTTASLLDDLGKARDSARQAFQRLPPSPERDSILGALGRMGKASLKRKVRNRVQVIAEAVGARFPELELVVDQAVDCRNYYVHGSISRIDYGKHDHLLSFLTNALEFVFAASDLVESGWDISDWVTQSSTLSHPFDNFRLSYPQRLAQLKKLL